MNQELYNQLLDGASVIVAVQKMEAAIEAKKNRWADLCVDYSEGEENIKKAKGSYGKWKGWGTFMMIFGLGNAAIVAFAILSVLNHMLPRHIHLPFEKVSLTSTRLQK